MATTKKTSKKTSAQKKTAAAASSVTTAASAFPKVCPNCKAEQIEKVCDDGTVERAAFCHHCGRQH